MALALPLPRDRAIALAAYLAALGVYTAGAGVLWDAGMWWDVAWLAVVVIPATFAFIWLALPLADARGLLAATVGTLVLALVFWAADLDTLFNLAKLIAFTLLGFWFLTYFETVAWAVLVAAIIPWVDAVSVWRGPTDYVVTEQPGLFEDLAVSFRIPGENDGAHLGPPDFLFFALFLAAAKQFGLRPGWTWIGMTGLLGTTLVLAVATDTTGLPALPAICLGFLVPNADLLWKQLRPRARARRERA
jgi:hypothetical protein